MAVTWSPIQERPRSRWMKRKKMVHQKKWAFNLFLKFWKVSDDGPNLLNVEIGISDAQTYWRTRWSQTKTRSVWPRLLSFICHLIENANASVLAAVCHSSVTACWLHYWQMHISPLNPHAFLSQSKLLLSMKNHATTRTWKSSMILTIWGERNMMKLNYTSCWNKDDELMTI